MKPRTRLMLVLLVGVPTSAVLYWFAISMRPLAPPAGLGPLVFRVVAVSNRSIESAEQHRPADQVWITLEVDPSNPRYKPKNLHVYLPGLFQNVELIGPDGSRQKPFCSQPLSPQAWYDSVLNIGDVRWHRMSFGFDNTAHWKTGTFTVHFSPKTDIIEEDEWAVAGRTLRIAPVELQ